MRGDVNRAADRVLAEQRTLRPAQHFDPVDAEQLRVRAKAARHVYAVDIERDGGVRGYDEVVFADTANKHREAARLAARARRRLQVGGSLLDAGDLLIAARFQRFATQSGDRDGNILQAFFAAARSDDDFARCAGRLGCFSWFFAGLRIDRRWRGAGKQQCRKPHCCGKRCCRGPKPEIDHGIPLFILNFPDS